VRSLAAFAAPHPITGERRTYELVHFSDNNPRDQMQQLRKMITVGAMDPGVHEMAVSIVQPVQARDNFGEADALLTWVQKNVRYTSEGTETFQGAVYTLEHRAGDCDDMVVLFCALCESLAIPTKLEVLGRKTGALSVDWFHIYARVGMPARKPTQWHAAECTIPGAGLGWEPIVYARQRAAHAASL
jgi:hypothetical protein